MNYTIGVVGLGVMGSNLARNIGRQGYSVAGYDIDSEKIRTLVESAGDDIPIVGVASLSELVKILVIPRCILLMVPAGEAVDNVIVQLKPHLEKGDILIDGGNSYFLDTEKRSKVLEEEGFHFIGMGVSGGEQGALWGPCLMPGGDRMSWEAIAPIFRSIAAKAEDGQPCVAYLGQRGAGHYVKMVHNGIEYADMQLIAEVYDFLSRGLGLSALTLHEIFEEWNAGKLQSYLIEITADIFEKIDEETNQPLVDLILDEAQQKGTGKWACQNAMDINVPVPTINAAVESRILSGLKEQRLQVSQWLKGTQNKISGNSQQWIEAARDALFASRISTYAQGMALLKQASVEYGYSFELGEIAKIWRGGCIIRASLLNKIMAAYQKQPNLVNLMVDDEFRVELESCQESWRQVVQMGISSGIPMLALSASLGYYDAFRSKRLPANLIQAQRDYFGAHTYRRVDREGTFHTHWK